MTFEAIDDHGHPGVFRACAWPGRRWRACGHHGGAQCRQRGGRGAFLERRIRFDQIHALNLETLSACRSPSPDRSTTCWRWTSKPVPARSALRSGWLDRAVHHTGVPMLTVVAFIVALGL
jgi:hypothetical protein